MINIFFILWKKLPEKLRENITIIWKMISTPSDVLGKLLLFLCVLYLSLNFLNPFVSKCVILIICVLVSTAYLTLMERKILALTQNRKGPSLVGVMGILQPIADGIKLFSKELIIPTNSSKWVFLIAPIICLTSAIILWTIVPMNSADRSFDYKYVILLIFFINSFSVVSILMSGWSSNCKYSFLGSLRCVAQMISYEVSLGFLINTVCLFSGSFSLVKLIEYQQVCGSLFFFVVPIFVIFFITLVAETNRAPFDLTEGESELVSGFNVEYSSFPFALFFLGEYSNILFSCFFLSTLFFSGNAIIKLFSFLFLVFIFILIRSSFPRVRYDHLMYFMWKNILPISLVIFNWIFLINIGGPVIS